MEILFLNIAANQWALFLKMNVGWSNNQMHLPQYKWLQPEKFRLQFTIIGKSRHQKQSLSQDWRCESKPPARESNSQPCAPQARFGAPLGKQLFWPRFSGFSVPWYSGWVAGHMHRYLAVAFLVSGLLQTTPRAPYPSKQQRPMAWITALR